MKSQNKTLHGTTFLPQVYIKTYGTLDALSRRQHILSYGYGGSRIPTKSKFRRRRNLSVL